MRGLKLEITPIPNSTWGVSLSGKLPKDEWDKIRRECYRQADYQCEICGAEDTLFAHEIWRFDNKKRIQHFAGLECCCRDCSDVHHFGRSSQVYSKARQEELIKHWCRTNGKTRRDFQTHLSEVFEISKKRVDKLYIVKIGNKILA